MDASIQRIVARFLAAARRVNVAPFKLDSCRHCGGEGTHTEKTLQVKSLCAACFGTGTDSKSFKTLQAETKELETRYQTDYDAFEKAKKQWGPGRSNPSFGRAKGMDLQTLRIRMTARQDQLKHEQERLDLGQGLAVKAGAAARAASK
jgi:hypothetical protein